MVIKEKQWSNIVSFGKLFLLTKKLSKCEMLYTDGVCNIKTIEILKMGLLLNDKMKEVIFCLL